METLTAMPAGGAAPLDEIEHDKFGDICTSFEAVAARADDAG